MTNCWNKWKQIHSKEIEHIAGYEEAFVDLVLCKIPLISPKDVIPQYHFVDDNGGNRYIDFMILNKRNGYHLPVELDGTFKDTDHKRWKDFLIRQNSLITQFGIVLRFSNKHMILETQSVIKKIEQTLSAQANNKISEDFKRKEREKLLADYKNKLQSVYIKGKISNKVTLEIGELKDAIDAISAQLANTKSEPAIKQKGSFVHWIGATAVAAFTIAVMFVSFSHRPTNLTSQNNETRASKPAATTLVSPKLQTQATFDRLDPRVTKIIEPQPNNLIVISNTSPSPQMQKLGKEFITIQDTREETIDDWQEMPEEFIKAALSPGAPTKQYVSIKSQEAPTFVGQNQTVCGQVAQVREFSRGIYLNFEKAFPENVFSAVVWDSDLRNVVSPLKPLTQYLNKNICVAGEISIYRNRVQIVVKIKTQIREN